MCFIFDILQNSAYHTDVCFRDSEIGCIMGEPFQLVQFNDYAAFPHPPPLATCTIQHCNILDNIKMVAVARADRHLLTTDEQPSLLSLITTLKSFSLRLLIHFSPYFSSQFVLAKNCNRLCQRRGTF